MVTQNTFRACEGRQVIIEEEKVKFATADDINNCHKQIKYRFRFNCAHLFLSYHNISKMEDLSGPILITFFLFKRIKNKIFKITAVFIHKARILQNSCSPTIDMNIQQNKMLPKS